MYTTLYSQNQPVSKYFDFKGNYSISFLGGGADILGKLGDQNSPVINSAISYHITDRFSVVADTIFYTSGPGLGTNEINKTDFEFNKAAHYGMALKYYTKKNLKCGTATLQTGAYLFDTGTDKPIELVIYPGVDLSS